jgi:hypothetical protein
MLLAIILIISNPTDAYMLIEIANAVKLIALSPISGSWMMP